MSELRHVSPLMDGMIVEKETPEHNGRSISTLRRSDTGERFILKRISVPASDSLVRALILSGAYPDEAAVHEYYGQVAADIQKELEIGKTLSASGCFAAALSYQVEPKPSGVGYDIYILYPLYVPLNALLAENLITKLRAVNLGIDLCDAVAACREAGYLFENIKPENIFLMPNGKFLLGDLGLACVDDLRYASVPEEYIGPYSAPELSDITASPNLTIDLYSLGMVLYRVYNANHGPFEDENTGEGMADKLRMTGKPLPTPLFADYELAAIILKACAFRQEDRYQSPGELKQALVLYMQRNEISDDLIVPPIVASSEPITEPETATEEEAEPVRMSNAEDLDENFRRSFAPDTTGGGSDELSAVSAASPEKEEKAEEPIAPEEPENAETPAEAEPLSPEGEEPDASEEADPDQLDLDSFLADLSQVMGEPEDGEAAENAEETPQQAQGELSLSFDEPDRTYVDGKETESADADEAPRRSKLPALLIALFVLLAAAVVAYFVVSWYFVDAKELKLVSVSTNELVMQLVVDDPQEHFTLTCTDSHGNSYPATVADDTYTFTGLSELTTYTVTVNAAKGHRLTTSSVLGNRVTTAEYTHISDLTATRGGTDDEVLLSFRHEGPAPEKWQISYTNADGTHRDSFSSEDSKCLVSGLHLNETYTFTLEDTDGCFLSGTTSVSYELIPTVEARNLNISDISGKDITVTWEAGENLPAEWLLSCEAAGFETLTQSVTGTSCTFTLEDLARDYTITLSARGMDEPQTLTLSADLIVVEGLEAVYHEDGTVTLSWKTPVGAPEGGWFIFYNTVDSLHEPYLFNSQPITDNSVTLEYLIPNAEYEFSLNVSATDAGKQLFGETSTRVKTGEIQNFDSFSITPKTPIDSASGYVSLWLLPEKTNWKYTDLSSRRTSFTANQKIAICVQVDGVAASDEQVRIAYVLRNSDGQVVNDIYADMPWSDLWYSRRHASAIPLPAAEGESSRAGSYRVEIYVNGKLLASAGFTVT